MTCILSLLPLPADADDRLPGPVEATVVQVRDGDTVVVDARIWPGQTIRVAVRLRGIDTPEIRGKCDQETSLALDAKARVIALIAGEEVTLRDIGGGKYFGRILARVFTGDRVDIASVLKAEGLARAYNGRKREGWCIGQLAQTHSSLLTKKPPLTDQ